MGPALSLRVTRVDAASLSAFRVLFGFLMATAMVRFVAKGWVSEIYLHPQVHFPWPGLEWIRPLPEPWMWLHVVVVVVAALAVGLGVKARAAAAVYVVGFTWLELSELAAYLNHYYLVSLLALMLAVVPTDQCLALWPERASPRAAGTTTLTALWLFRGLIITVYLSAALAKVGEDWLLRGEPLRTWLQVHHGLPLIGPLLALPGVAVAMSWAGLLYDLSIWAFLLWPKTRHAAVVVNVGFHVVVWLLFPIGMFSWIMLTSATLLWSPSWPRRLSSLLGATPATSSLSAIHMTPTSKAAALTAAAFIALQLALPHRHWLRRAPGDGRPVNWTELGFRFSWRVMLIEKTGLLEYRVVTARHPEGVRVRPAESLSRLQAKQLVTQPDMIWRYARVLRAQFEAHGDDVVGVYADSFVSLNGRRSQRMIDPETDLSSVSLGFAILPEPAPWILPLVNDKVEASPRRQRTRRRRAAKLRRFRVADNERAR